MTCSTRGRERRQAEPGAGRGPRGLEGPGALWRRRWPPGTSATRGSGGFGYWRAWCPLQKVPDGRRSLWTGECGKGWERRVGAEEKGRGVSGAKECKRWEFPGSPVFRLGIFTPWAQFPSLVGEP